MRRMRCESSKEGKRSHQPVMCACVAMIWLMRSCSLCTSFALWKLCDGRNRCRHQAWRLQCSTCHQEHADRKSFYAIDRLWCNARNAPFVLHVCTKIGRLSQWGLSADLGAMIACSSHETLSFDWVNELEDTFWSTGIKQATQSKWPLARW